MKPISWAGRLVSSYLSQPLPIKSSSHEATASQSFHHPLLRVYTSRYYYTVPQIDLLTTATDSPRSSWSSLVASWKSWRQVISLPFIAPHKRISHSPHNQIVLNHLFSTTYVLFIHVPISYTIPWPRPFLINYISSVPYAFPSSTQPTFSLSTCLPPYQSTPSLKTPLALRQPLVLLSL